MWYFNEFSLKSATIQPDYSLVEHALVLPCLSSGLLGYYKHIKQLKTRLVPQINKNAMTSTWLVRSCDLRETLIGGRLHCANNFPAVPRPSPNYSIHKQRKDIKTLFPGKYLISYSILC